MSKNTKKQRDWGSIKLYSITGFICVGIISMAALSNHNEGKWVNSVNKFNYESRNHVKESPKYKELSPVGGDHFGTWQNCGFYSKPIENGNGVHSLEHGAVWLTYNTNLSDDELNKLKEYAQISPYVLVSPLSNINNKLTLSAWNRQLILDNVNDDRVLKFIKMFVSGPQTPEPGAPCWGGLGEPEYGTAG
jgi:hypothetical protein